MSGAPARPKPWEQAGAAASASGGAGPPKPWERPANGGSTVVTPASSALPLESGGAGDALVQRTARPWERQGVTSSGLASTSSYGGAGYLGQGAGATGGSYGLTNYGSNTGYGGGYGTTTGYGGGMYGSRLGYGAGALGTSSYGGGMYGGSSYGGGSYGGGMYSGAGGMYGSSNGGGMYGGAGGMYGGGGGMYGRPGMYGGAGGMYGSAPPGGMFGPQDPHGPPAPPSAWQAMLAAVGGVVHFFGRLSFLVDENAHAVHFFITALLQLLDRVGSLYGELARFVLRMLGYKGAKHRPKADGGPGGPPGGPAGQPPPGGPPHGGPPPGMPSSFDNLWPSGGHP